MAALTPEQKEKLANEMSKTLSEFLNEYWKAYSESEQKAVENVLKPYSTIEGNKIKVRPKQVILAYNSVIEWQKKARKSTLPTVSALATKLFTAKIEEPKKEQPTQQLTVNSSPELKDLTAEQITELETLLREDLIDFLNNDYDYLGVRLKENFNSILGRYFENKKLKQGVPPSTAYIALNTWLSKQGKKPLPPISILKTTLFSELNEEELEQGIKRFNRIVNVLTKNETIPDKALEEYKEIIRRSPEQELLYAYLKDLVAKHKLDSIYSSIETNNNNNNNNNKKEETHGKEGSEKFFSTRGIDTTKVPKAHLSIVVNHISYLEKLTGKQVKLQ
jgi:DNA-binding MarR family transcriptional regulator